MPGTESQFSQYEFSFLLVPCRENLVDAKDDFHKLTFTLGLATQIAPFCFVSTKMAELPGNALLQATFLNYNIEFKNEISCAYKLGSCDPMYHLQLAFPY